MIFGISDKDLMNKNKVKIINGIAGSGKSTSTVNELRKLGSNFCLASFSNALKFAAEDKFGCKVDTICSACFVNTPFPRYEEKEVKGVDTIVTDEILLDGVDTIKWIMHNVGKVNIIALTDSRQMLNADNGREVLKAFEKLCASKNTICVEVTETKRARNDETVNMYNTLFNINSNQLLGIQDVVDLFKCDVVSFNDIDFSKKNTYICHSNKIEHEIYKRYDLSNNRDNDLIPKNHISRKRDIDLNKYPICDQITAIDKKLDSYLQVANVATPTRFQGKEVSVGDECYFIIERNNLFTGREIYTVGTRCQDMKSLHLVIIDIEEYKDPEYIQHTKVVSAKRLDIPDYDGKFKYVTVGDIAKVIKQYGDENTNYYPDYITSGNKVIYSSLSASSLNKFADINEDPDNYTVTIRKVKGGRRKSIKSITKKDTTMHFDYMPKVYDILKIDVKPPRINNPSGCSKNQFEKLCDIYSAFPTVLHNAPMPKAGVLYEEYDENLLNFYIYKGNVVTRGSLITEELAKLLGESEYMFSTEKQIGCEIGHYTYEESRKSKEKKKAVNNTFLWGILESDYYRREQVISKGELVYRYVKHECNTLELVACALWSSLCCVMLNAINSLGIKSFMVVTDGLYYTSDKEPEMPEWCDYRIEDRVLTNILGGDEKYNNIITKTYDDIPTELDLKRERDKEHKKNKRANMTDEERAAARAKDAERKRLARAKKKAEQL